MTDLEKIYICIVIFRKQNSVNIFVFMMRYDMHALERELKHYFCKLEVNMSCRYRKQTLFPWRTFKIYYIEVDFMKWSCSQLLRSRAGLVKFYNPTTVSTFSMGGNRSTRRKTMYNTIVVLRPDSTTAKYFARNCLSRNTDGCT